VIDNGAPAPKAPYSAHSDGAEQAVGRVLYNETQRHGHRAARAQLERY